MKQLPPCDHDECPLTKCNMNTQQYPEHILKQADELNLKAATEVCRQLNLFQYVPPSVASDAIDYAKVSIRDTLNLPALLMAKENESDLRTIIKISNEQLSQHQQVVKQLVEALEKYGKHFAWCKGVQFKDVIISEDYCDCGFKQALSTAKQLLEKKV